jgi:DNA-directed RNA polymerase specialized sigma24 family protein
MRKLAKKLVRSCGPFPISLECLYPGLRKILLKTAKRRVWNYHDREDLVDQVFLEVQPPRTFYALGPVGLIVGKLIGRLKKRCTDRLGVQDVERNVRFALRDWDKLTTAVDARTANKLRPLLQLPPLRYRAFEKRIKQALPQRQHGLILPISALARIEPRRGVRCEEIETVPPLEQPATISEYHEELEGVMESISPELSEVARRMKRANETAEDIAKELHIPVNRLHKRLSRFSADCRSIWQSSRFPGWLARYLDTGTRLTFASDPSSCCFTFFCVDFLPFWLQTPTLFAEFKRQAQSDFGDDVWDLYDHHQVILNLSPLRLAVYLPTHNVTRLRSRVGEYAVMGSTFSEQLDFLFQPRVDVYEVPDKCIAPMSRRAVMLYGIYGSSHKGVMSSKLVATVGRSESFISLCWFADSEWVSGFTNHAAILRTRRKALSKSALLLGHSRVML